MKRLLNCACAALTLLMAGTVVAQQKATISGVPDIPFTSVANFLKLPAGFVVPLHTHTNAMKVVFISGTYIQAPEGKSEVRLGPGSYMMQPGGNYRHTTSCDKASECVFFVESNGRFDLKLVEPGKAPAKK